MLIIFNNINIFFIFFIKNISLNKMNSNKSKKNHMHEIAVPIGLYLAKESVKTVKDKKDKKTKKNKKSNKKKVVTRVRKVAVGGVAPTSDLSDSIHLKNALSNSVSASEYTGLEGGVWPFTSKKKTSVVAPIPKSQNNPNNSNSNANSNANSTNSNNIPNMYPSNNNTSKSIKSDNIPNIQNISPPNNVKGGNTTMTYYKYWVNKKLKSLSASQSNMSKNERLLTVRKLWNEYKNMPQFERNKNNYDRNHGLLTTKNNKVKMQNAGTTRRVNTNELNKKINKLEKQKKDNNIKIKELEQELKKKEEEYKNISDRKSKLWKSILNNSQYNRNTPHEEKRNKAFEHKDLERNVSRIGKESFNLQKNIKELKEKNKIIDDDLQKISIRLVVRDKTKGQAQNNIVQTVSKYL
tara:strand:+ start:9531 stop:10754 length:1224 start_codon:yes stop_codon:yes gene_type:complete